MPFGPYLHQVIRCSALTIAGRLAEAGALGEVEYDKAVTYHRWRSPGPEVPRARTGKAALYRLWPGKHELVLAAIRHALPALPDPDPDRSVRDNLLTVFTTLCEILAGDTPLPSISIAIDLLREPALRASFADDIVVPRLRVIESILRHGGVTGEINPDALSPLAAHTGPTLILQARPAHRKTPSRRGLDLIIDTVLRGT